MRCKECRYYDGCEAARGDCHRFPPLSVSIDGSTIWPSVIGQDDWCGEFVSKDAPRAKSDPLLPKVKPCPRCGRTTVQSGGLCSYCDTGNA